MYRYKSISEFLSTQDGTREARAAMFDTGEGQFRSKAVVDMVTDTPSNAGDLLTFMRNPAWPEIVIVCAVSNITVGEIARKMYAGQLQETDRPFIHLGVPIASVLAATAWLVASKDFQSAVIPAHVHPNTPENPTPRVIEKE